MSIPPYFMDAISSAKAEKRPSALLCAFNGLPLSVEFCMAVSRGKAVVSEFHISTLSTNSFAVGDTI
jgi:hypothetical protein